MIKVFSHWIHWKTIVQVVLDIFFPVACVFLAVLFWGIGEKTNLEVVVVYALIYALVMVVFNSWLGLYSRTHPDRCTNPGARRVVAVPFRSYRL